MANPARKKSRGAAHYREAAPSSLSSAGLDSGERAVFFHKISPLGWQVGLALSALGLVIISKPFDDRFLSTNLLLWGCAMVLVVVACFVHRWVGGAQIVTTKLLMLQAADGRVRSVPLSSIASLDAVRRTSSGGGGVVGLVTLAVSAAINRADSRNSQLDPAFWSGAVAVVVTTNDDERIKIRTPESYKLGLMLARYLDEPKSIPSLPAVPFNL